MANTGSLLHHEFANINGIKMHYATIEEGPLIVFCTDSQSFGDHGSIKFPFFQTNIKWLHWICEDMAKLKDL